MPRNIAGTESFTGGPYQLPENGDRGEADVFDILEQALERLANHSHSGVDSNSISLNIEKDIEAFTIGTNLSWVLQTFDTYRAQLDVPAGTTFDTSIRKYFFSDGADWVEFYPEVEKIDDNNYYIYANDNTINIRVITL